MPKAAGVARRAKPVLPSDNDVHMLKENRSGPRDLAIVTRCDIEGRPYDGERGLRTSVWSQDITCPACADTPGVSGP